MVDVDTSVDDVDVDTRTQSGVIVDVRVGQGRHSSRHFVRVGDAAEAPCSIRPAPRSQYKLEEKCTKVHSLSSLNGHKAILVDALNELRPTQLVEGGLVEDTGEAVNHSPVIVRDALAQSRIVEQSGLVGTLLEADDVAAGVDLARVLGDLDQLVRCGRHGERECG